MEYRIRIEPDGSITVTWPEPTPEDPQARNAAIPDRDGMTALLLSYLLDHLRAGTR